MGMRIHTLSFPLSQFVERMWHAQSAGTPGTWQRMYPNGAMGLFISLNRTTASFSVGGDPFLVGMPLIAGPWSRPFLVDASQPSSVIGVEFRPGCASRFFAVRPHELHNADLALRDLDAREADGLLNDLTACDDGTAHLRIVERYLLGKLTQALPAHPAVAHAAAQLARGAGVPRVRTIQRESGLSHTRFIELFREHVGLTPKLFCRVQRFRSLIDRIPQGIPVNWAALAMECGYYDQAHLIHDFRAFAGVTPGEYHRTIPG